MTPSLSPTQQNETPARCLIPLGNLLMHLKGISHELNSHLSIATCRIEIIDELLQETSSSGEINQQALKEQLSSIQLKVSESIRIAKSFAQYLFPLSGMISEFDLTKLARELIQMIQKDLSYFQIQLDLDISDQAVLVSGQYQQLLQVILSFFSYLLFHYERSGPITWKLHCHFEEERPTLTLKHTQNLLPPPQEIENFENLKLCDLSEETLIQSMIWESWKIFQNQYGQISWEMGNQSSQINFQFLRS